MTRVWAPILALFLVVCAGCMRPASAWQPSQAEATAWWIEDLAHGNPRSIDEIDFIPGNERTRAILQWARGGAPGAGWQPPQMVASRSQRWPQLRRALAEGGVVPVAETGLIAPFAGLAPRHRVAIEALVDAENAERRLLDHLVLELGRSDSGTEAAYRDALRCARRTLDAALGAHDVPGSGSAH